VTITLAMRGLWAFTAARLHQLPRWIAYVLVYVDRYCMSFCLEKRLHRGFKEIGYPIRHRGQQHEKQPEPRLILIIGNTELPTKMRLVRLPAGIAFRPW
jgi:hypothetical protein